MQKTGAGEKELKYTIDTELSLGNLEFLPEYLKRHYLLRHEKHACLEEPEKIKHAFLKSIKYALKGFLRA